MEPDGRGLASVLAYLSSNEPTRFEELQSALRGVIPSVARVRTPRAKVVVPVSEIVEVNGKSYSRREDREYWGNRVEFDMVAAPDISADLASEGTMLVLGILAAIIGPNRPHLMLLDDIDRALHPKAQGDLVALLRKLLEAYPGLQIVATSHSPYLLDHLKPEEIRLTMLEKDGSVAVRKLEDHPQFDRWREEMEPGEFWSMVGESWIAQAEAEDPR
jgi:predicted ATPase